MVDPHTCSISKEIERTWQKLKEKLHDKRKRKRKRFRGKKDLKDCTGPTSLKISMSSSSVVSYEIFPTGKIIEN